MTVTSRTPRRTRRWDPLRQGREDPQFYVSGERIGVVLTGPRAVLGSEVDGETDDVTVEPPRPVPVGRRRRMSFGTVHWMRMSLASGTAGDPSFLQVRSQRSLRLRLPRTQLVSLFQGWNNRVQLVVVRKTR